MKTHFACRFQHAALFLFVVPLMCAISAAEAQAPRANAYVTTNVNHRAGPSTQYPALGIVPARSYVTIHGCLQALDWCDVTYRNARGWMAATYLRAYHQRYMPVAEYVRAVRLPIVVFEIQSYWPRYYRDRPFFAELNRWSRPRPARGVTEAVFYQPLARHGSWVVINNQRCWVPDRVDRDWRPYTKGRWVFAKRYGWTWVSNEPFGWATYHYGRWGFSKRVGWFWVPGTRWAPAWVAWRGDDDHLAWAPLPPDRDPSISIEISIGNVPDYYWQGVPSSAFLSADLSDHVIRDNRDYLRDTRPIGNVTIVNNVVVNNVINVEYVEQKTQETVVAQEIAATTTPEESGKVEGGKVEILTAEAAAAIEAPTATPEVKPIEQVEAEATTKEQAGDEAATEELVAAPTATSEGQSPPEAGAPPVDAGATPEAPSGETPPVLPPPDGTAAQPPSPDFDQANEPPPPPADGIAPATPPVLPPPVEGTPAPQSEQPSEPPPPVETAPQELPAPPELAPPPESIPPSEPPPPVETAPQELPAPPEPAPPPESIPPSEPPPPTETVPQELTPPPEAAPPPEPPPPPPETAPPPELAPPSAPPPPAETAPQEPPPPPEPAAPIEPPPPPVEVPPEPAPPAEAAPPTAPAPEQPSCPEGTVLQQDGQCAPPQ